MCKSQLHANKCEKRIDRTPIVYLFTLASNENGIGVMGLCICVRRPITGHNVNRLLQHCMW
jgi:hypothetical protein